MKFGRRLQDAIRPIYRQHYIDYKELKKAIKVITGEDASAYTISEVTSNFGNIQALAGSIYRPPEARFQELLNHQAEKINKFTALIFEAISSNLREVLKRLCTNDITPSSLEVGTLEDQIEAASEDIVFLDGYIRINFVGFRKITKKYDKHNNSNSSAWYLSRLIREPFVNANFDYPLELLSACYAEVRRLQSVATAGGVRGDREEDSGGVGQALGQPGDLAEQQSHRTPSQCPDTRSAEGLGSTSSSRLSEPRTTKYLVRSEDTMRIRVALIRSIRLKAMGVKECRTATQLLDPKNLKGAAVSSDSMSSKRQQRMSTGVVYLDNPQREIYNSSLSRRRGVKQSPNLLRFRWAGENEGGNDGSLPVVLELVSATEASNEPSEWPCAFPVDNNQCGPECVLLQQKYIPAILDGTLNVDEWVAKHSAWPGLGDARIPAQARQGQMKSFLNAAMLRVRERHLSPVLQVWSYRTTLQSEEDGGVFANLDENIRFVAEGPDAISGDSSVAARNWIRPHTECLVADSVVRFGFGVLDVTERAGSRPDFLDDITGITSVTEVSKFSTFAHGVAALNKPQQATLPVPHWYNFVIAHDETDDFLTDVPTRSTTRRTSGNLLHSPKPSGPPLQTPTTDDRRRDSDVRLDVITTRPSARLLHDQALSIQADSSSNASAGHAPLSADIEAQRYASATAEEPRRASPLLSTTQRSMLHTPARGMSDLTQPLLHDGGHDERARLLHEVPPSPAPFVTSSTRDAVVPLQPPQSFGRWLSDLLYRMTSMTGVSGRAPGLAVGSAAVRVEPKTFFANERTLLQWMNTAVLLSTISITLLNFGTPTGRIAGLILAPVALFFILYSFMVYLRRSYSLERKEPINYNDRIGPAILVVCLVAALSSIILLNVLYGGNNANGGHGKHESRHRSGVAVLNGSSVHRVVS